MKVHECSHHRAALSSLKGFVVGGAEGGGPGTGGGARERGGGSDLFTCSILVALRVEIPAAGKFKDVLGFLYSYSTCRGNRCSSRSS